MNLSTVATVLPAPGVAIYAASKAAVEQFTLVAARELAARANTVNTFSPGFIDTELFHELGGPGAAAWAEEKTPWGGSASPPTSPTWWGSWSGPTHAG